MANTQAWNELGVAIHNAGKDLPWQVRLPGQVLAYVTIAHPPLVCGGTKTLSIGKILAASAFLEMA